MGFPSYIKPVANHKSIWTSISGASKHGYIVLKHQKRGMIPSFLAVPLVNFQGLGVAPPTFFMAVQSFTPARWNRLPAINGVNKWGYITLANHLLSAIYCGKITCYDSTYNWIVWGPPILGASFISQKAPFGKGEGHEDFLWMATFFAYLHLGGCCENSRKCGTQTSSVSRSLLRSTKFLVG